MDEEGGEREGRGEGGKGREEGGERGVRGGGRKRYTYGSRRYHTPCYFAHHSPGVGGNKVLCRVVQGHQDVWLHLVRGIKRREEAERNVCACIIRYLMIKEPMNSRVMDAR